MAILRWGSSRELILLSQRMGKLFDEALAALSADVKMPSPWIPPCDIYETAGNFTLKVEVPGMELTGIVLEIHDNVVTLAGERRRRREDAGNYHRVERNEGRFVRSFTLPRSVEDKNVSATLKDGVLTVTLPKKSAKRASKTVEIKVK